MIKFFRHKILYLFLISINLSFAQNSSGIITYEGNINKVYVDSFSSTIKDDKSISMAAKQSILGALVDTDTDIFVLTFRGNESFYSYKEPLSTPVRYNVGSKSSKVPHYYNTETDGALKMSPSLGNIRKEEFNWNITKETKQIGDYLCYKAITSETFYRSNSSARNEQIIAWFTPSIPVNFGPLHYVGLPGLILELNRQRFTLRAKEVVLNPKEDVKIIRPKKNAKIIDEEEMRRRIKESRALLTKG